MNETPATYVYTNPYPSPPPLPLTPLPPKPPERNKPCPCGSGKKYKKCCMLKDFQKEQAKQEQEELEWNEWFEADLAQGRQNMIEFNLLKLQDHQNFMTVGGESC